LTRIPITAAVLAFTIVAMPMAAPAASPDDDVTALASAMAAEWLGARSTPGAGVAGAPLWQGRGAMIVEARVAARVIRGWWPAQLADAEAGAILDGFATYLQTLVIEQVFDRRYLRPAHSVESLPYFGGRVIWSFPPLRLSRHAAAGRDRHAAIFAALEKWIGLPALQAAMFAVARLPSERLTGPAIVETISQASGQDVSWLFASAGLDFNYAVVSLASSPVEDCKPDCYDTVIMVGREGDGAFPGRTAARAGRFDSGDALELRVVFRDGSTTGVRWDGRDRSRAFRFRGPSPATAAYLDPSGQVTLDGNRLDNAIVPAARTNVPVRKWAARWMVWLQHTMLAYGFLA
jgi:hypothetical protein